MKRRTMTYVIPIVVSGVIAATMAGCSGSADRDEIVIVAEASGWTATGGAVDAGVMCPGGVQSLIGFLELDGSPLAPDEGAERLVEGLWDDPLDEVADFLGVHEVHVRRWIRFLHRGRRIPQRRAVVDTRGDRHLRRAARVGDAARPSVNRPKSPIPRQAGFRSPQRSPARSRSPSDGCRWVRFGA